MLTREVRSLRKPAGGVAQGRFLLSIGRIVSRGNKANVRSMGGALRGEEDGFAFQRGGGGGGGRNTNTGGDVGACGLAFGAATGAVDVVDSADPCSGMFATAKFVSPGIGNFAGAACAGVGVVTGATFLRGGRM